MDLIDTHVHLSDSKFDDDREQVVGRALSNSVAMITVAGSSDSVRQQMLQVAELHQSVWICFGVHPFNADLADETALRNIEHLAGHPKVVGIGEIGLDQDDWDFDIAPFDVQQRAFVDQLALAVRVKLPVALHLRARSAVDVAIEIMNDTGVPNGGRCS
jgi:TatD DNase family protein